MKLFYNDILVYEVMSNMSLSVDDVLSLMNFNEADFIAKHGFDDIDYNDFYVVG